MKKKKEKLIRLQVLMTEKEKKELALKSLKSKPKRTMSRILMDSYRESLSK